jgi:hypothetical protein
MSAERPLTDFDYELLSAHLDGALSNSERSVLEARLHNEPALRRELEAMRQTVALVNDLPLLKAPRDFTLDTSIVRARPLRLLIFPTTAAFSALSAAAAVLLLVLAGFLLLSQSSPNLAQPQSVQQIAANPTTAITNEEVAEPASISPTLLPTQATTPVPAPQEALGLAAADEQSQEGESADSAASAAQPSSSTEPLAAAPTLEAPAAGFAADTAQSEIASEESEQIAPPPAPQETSLADTTTFAYTPTTPQSDVEDAAAGSRATDNRLMIEETATSLSESLSVAQAQITVTPERERDDDVSHTASPAMTSIPPSTPASLQDGLLERERQSGDQNTLVNVLLAAGILLLAISSATTLARIRR